MWPWSLGKNSLNQELQEILFLKTNDKYSVVKKSQGNISCRSLAGSPCSLCFVAFSPSVNVQIFCLNFVFKDHAPVEVFFFFFFLILWICTLFTCLSPKSSVHL